MLRAKNKRVKLIRDEEDKYIVIGLPSNKIFKRFKKVAKSKLEELLENIRKKDPQRFGSTRQSPEYEI